MGSIEGKNCEESLRALKGGGIISNFPRALVQLSNECGTKAD